jgi:hypothetical protein
VRVVGAGRAHAHTYTQGKARTPPPPEIVDDGRSSGLLREMMMTLLLLLSSCPAPPTHTRGATPLAAAKNTIVVPSYLLVRVRGATTTTLFTPAPHPTPPKKRIASISIEAGAAAVEEPRFFFAGFCSATGLRGS